MLIPAIQQSRYETIAIWIITLVMLTVLLTAEYSSSLVL